MLLTTGKKMERYYYVNMPESGFRLIAVQNASTREKVRVDMDVKKEEDDYKKYATDIDNMQDNEKFSCLRYIFEIPDGFIWFNANIDNLDAIYVKHKGITKEYKLCVDCRGYEQK